MLKLIVDLSELFRRVVCFVKLLLNVLIAANLVLELNVQLVIPVLRCLNLNILVFEALCNFNVGLIGLVQNYFSVFQLVFEVYSPIVDLGSEKVHLSDNFLHRIHGVEILGLEGLLEVFEILLDLLAELSDVDCVILLLEVINIPSCGDAEFAHPLFFQF